MGDRRAGARRPDRDVLRPETRAPITLLELGLFAASGKQVVCRPGGYWRKGNVEVVCARYRIPLVETLPAPVALVRSRLGTE